MAKRRRRSRTSGSNAGAFGLLAMILVFGAYGSLQEAAETRPWLLPVIVVCIIWFVGIAFGLWLHYHRKTGLIKEAFTLANIDTMTGEEFEEYVAFLLRKRGYTGVKLTEKFDHGVDIIAKKDGITWGIQTKRYKKPVKEDGVRQVIAGLAHYSCDRAAVITNSTYTRRAQMTAQENNCVLIGREELEKWVYEVSNKQMLE